MENLKKLLDTALAQLFYRSQVGFSPDDVEKFNAEMHRVTGDLGLLFDLRFSGVVPGNEYTREKMEGAPAKNAVQCTRVIWWCPVCGETQVNGYEECNTCGRIAEKVTGFAHTDDTKV